MKMGTGAQEVGRRRTGPIQRVAATDFATAEEVLKTAELLIVPDGQSQRRAFEKLMPHLYVLRHKGCSFSQLAKLLGDVGIKLQPSTVRAYYHEMLAERMDICQARMNEQIALMAAIRAETQGADASAISGRVTAYLDRLKSAATSKVNAMFGDDQIAPRTVEAQKKPQLAPPPSASLIQRPTPPALPAATAEEQDTPAGEFGLLGIPSPSQPNASTGFIDLEPRFGAKQPATSKSAPRQEAPHGSPTSSGKPSKRLRPMQDGVPPLKKRDAVPAYVYEAGELEHPAIPGLMLALEHRIYGAALEYYEVDGPDAGEIKMETPDQKRFRVVWRQTVPVTQTRTAGSFTKMDTSLFPEKG